MPAVTNTAEEDTRRRIRLPGRFLARRRRESARATTPVEVSLSEEGVLHLHLRGGARRNVLGRSTVDAIDRAVADPPPGTKVVLITAEPPYFCAGYDLDEAFHHGAEGLLANEANFAALRRSDLVVVAALRGNVIGGGLELALLADVRIAAFGTRFAVPANRLGLVYSEAGVRLFVSQLGESATRTMLLGGSVLHDEVALSLGVVTEITDAEGLDRRALQIAASIATTSELARRGNRRVLNAVAGRIVADTAALHRESFATDGDLAASIAAFVEQRRLVDQAASGHVTSPMFLRARRWWTRLRALAARER